MAANIPEVCMICYPVTDQLKTPIAQTPENRIGVFKVSASFDSVVATECGHLFHQSCFVDCRDEDLEFIKKYDIKEFEEAQHPCPKCNTPIRNVYVAALNSLEIDPDYEKEEPPVMGQLNKYLLTPKISKEKRGNNRHR